MQNLLISILKPKLAELPFVSLFGGLAHTLRTTSTSGAPQRMPISKEATILQDRSLGPEQYVSLVPDGAERGVAYFEHRSLKVQGVASGRANMTSVLRYVFWGNLGFGDSAAALAQLAVIKRIPDAKYNAGALVGIFHQVTGIFMPQDGLFDKYTYNEAELQYLMSPYTAFGIEITTAFSLPLAACVATTDPTDA